MHFQVVYTSGVELHLSSNPIIYLSINLSWQHDLLSLVNHLLHVLIWIFVNAQWELLTSLCFTFKLTYDLLYPISGFAYISRGRQAVDFPVWLLFFLYSN